MVSELLPEYRSAIAAEDDFRSRVRAIFRASARIHARNPTITPFLASLLPIELRRHPDLLPSLQTDGDDLVSVFVAMFDEARQRGRSTRPLLIWI
jgi:AcrR family transcriptional regulator